MSKASKGSVPRPSVELLLSRADRSRIVATLETMPEDVRGKDVPRLVNLVEAALLENLDQLFDLPPPDRRPEQAAATHLRAVTRHLGALRAGLASVPAEPKGDYFYWSQPFARAVFYMYPAAKFAQHVELVTALRALANVADALTAAAQPADAAGPRPPRASKEKPDGKKRRTKQDFAPEELEPVARLVRAVCYYLYEQRYKVDLGWEPPGRDRDAEDERIRRGGDKASSDEPSGTLARGSTEEPVDLQPSSPTTYLLEAVASAFGFVVKNSRLRTRLRDYRDVLKMEPSESGAHSQAEDWSYSGKRRGQWRTPVIADLGGVVVEVMLADAEETASQSVSDQAGGLDALEPVMETTQDASDLMSPEDDPTPSPPMFYSRQSK